MDITDIHVRLVVRIEPTVGSLALPDMEVRADGKHEVVVSLKQVWVGERRRRPERLRPRKPPHGEHENRGEAVGRFTVPDELREAFRLMAIGELDVMPLHPSWDSPHVRRVSGKQADAPGGWDSIVWEPWALLPEAFKGFCDGTRLDLRSSIVRAVGLTRWRIGQKVPNVVTKDSRFEWSLNGLRWYTMPSERPIGGASSLLLSQPLTVDEIEAEVEARLRREQEEPLAHQLFNEAWPLRTTAPRSALVIGIAAVEIGFKQWVINLAPQEASQVEASRPTLEVKLTRDFPRMLATYLGGRWSSPPQAEVMDPIVQGISARNGVAHFPPTSPRYERATQYLEASTLENLLLAISDFLWLLDFYGGATWALDHVRDGTRQAWEQV